MANQRGRGGRGAGGRGAGRAPARGGAGGRGGGGGRGRNRRVVPVNDSAAEARPVHDLYEAEDEDPDEEKFVYRFDSVDNFNYEMPSDYEDEEIPEDEAFTEEDKIKYAHWFGNPDDEAGGDDDDDDKDDDGEGGGQLLDSGEEDEDGEGGEEYDRDDFSEEEEEGDDEEVEEGGKQQGGAAQRQGGPSVTRARLPWAQQDGGASSDDDEAGGAASDEDGDEDGEDGARHEDLLAAVRTGGATAGARRRRRTAPVATEVYAEGEYNAEPRSMGSGGGEGAGELTVADLLAGLGDGARKLGAARKVLERLSKGAGGSAPVEAPLPGPIKERQQRKAGYEDTTKDVSKWQPIVKANREAPTLRFDSGSRASVPRLNSTAALAAQFEPQTDLEAEVAALLQRAGAGSARAVAQAEEQLASKAVSAEEMRERREKLSKMRSLLFYHEQKLKRLSKIKSKEYRRRLNRAAKKKAEKLGMSGDGIGGGAEADEDELRRAAEEAEFERAKERLTLKHKNTSRWARRALRRGVQVMDEGTKAALAEQMRLGQEIRQRVDRAGYRRGSSSSEGDDDEDGGSTSGSDGEEGGQEVGRRRRGGSSGRPTGGKARAAALDILAGSGGDTEAPSKGLFSLPFMQRAMQRKQQEAQQAAQQLLQDLEEEEGGGGGSDEDDDVLGLGGARDDIGGFGALPDGDAPPRTQATTSEDGVGGGDRAGSKAAAVQRTLASGRMRFGTGGGGGGAAKQAAALKAAVDAGGHGSNGELASSSGDDEEGGEHEDAQARQERLGATPGARAQAAAAATTAAASAGAGARITSIHPDSLSRAMGRRANGRSRAVASSSGRPIDVEVAAAAPDGPTARGSGGGGVSIGPRSAAANGVHGSTAAAAAAAAGEDSGGGGDASFVTAKRFQGARPGYVFQSGPRGVGYYLDQPDLNGTSSSKQQQQQHARQRDDGGSGSGLANGNGAAAQRQPTQPGGSDSDSDGGLRNMRPACGINGGVGSRGASAAGATAQEDLVRRAFAGDDVAAEFEADKAAEAQAELPKIDEPATLPGWGMWASVQREPRWMQAQRAKAAKQKAAALASRKDAKLAGVVVSEKWDKKATKYLTPGLPFPYDSQETYERSMRQPLGRQFNTDAAFRDMTRPAVLTSTGVIIEPVRFSKPLAADLDSRQKAAKRKKVAVLSGGMPKKSKA